MAHKNHPKNGLSYESIEDYPAVPEIYDLRRARKASKHRENRLGYLALTKRTNSFNKRVDGLWVPQSAEEYQFIINKPFDKPKQTKHHHKNRLNQSQSSEKFVEYFYSYWQTNNPYDSDKELNKHFEYFLGDSIKRKTELLDGLNKKREFTTKSINSSGLAINALTEYIINLASFVGTNTQEDEELKWLKPGMNYEMAAAKEETHDYIARLPNSNFFGLYDEALQSNWSREVFWQSVLKNVII